MNEAVAALPTLRPALEACRPSAERAYPNARLVAQLSLNDAGVVSAVQLREAETHPTTTQWHACAGLRRAFTSNSAFMQMRRPT